METYHALTPIAPSQPPDEGADQHAITTTATSKAPDEPEPAQRRPTGRREVAGFGGELVDDEVRATPGGTGPGLLKIQVGVPGWPVP